MFLRLVYCFLASEVNLKQHVEPNVTFQNETEQSGVKKKKQIVISYINNSINII